MKYDPQKKPAPSVCPQKYCFNWCEEGSSLAPGLYDSLEDSLDSLKPVSESGCGCSFGVCIRLDEVDGDNDWYEPCEPALQKDGLPWFYFMPTPLKLVDELQSRYILESELLWGTEHWKQKR